MKKTVLVRGPALSRSGYGEHTRFVLRSLREYEEQFDVYLINTNWGQTGWIYEDNEERNYIDELLRKHIARHQNGLGYDTSVQVTIPNEWEKLAEENIGVTAGIETTKVSHKWLAKGMLVDIIIIILQHLKKC